MTQKADYNSLALRLWNTRKKTSYVRQDGRCNLFSILLTKLPHFNAIEQIATAIYCMSPYLTSWAADGRNRPCGGGVILLLQFRRGIQGQDLHRSPIL